MRFLLVSGLCLAMASTACSTCDKEGCDAMEEPAPSGDIVTGIAGAASSQSDVVANGCATCSLSQGTLYVWASAGPLEYEDDVVALINANPEDFRVEVDGFYQQSLEPGTYAACVLNSSEGKCAIVTIEQGQVATVHLRFVFGPADLVVFEPGSDSPRSSGIYELSGDQVPALD